MANIPREYCSKILQQGCGQIETDVHPQPHFLNPSRLILCFMPRLPLTAEDTRSYTHAAL